MSWRPSHSGVWVKRADADDPWLHANVWAWCGSRARSPKLCGARQARLVCPTAWRACSLNAWYVDPICMCRLLGTLHAGDHFGSLGDGIPHAGTVVATTHVEAYSISRADLDVVLQQWPELSARLGTAGSVSKDQQPPAHDSSSSTRSGSQQPQPHASSAPAALDHSSTDRCPSGLRSGSSAAAAPDTVDSLPAVVQGAASAGLLDRLERRSVPAGRTSSNSRLQQQCAARRLSSGASMGLDRSSPPLGVSAASSAACCELATLGDAMPMRRASQQGSGLFRSNSGGGARYLFPAFENRPM